MTKEQEIIVVEELEQLIEKSKDLSEEEFYTIFTIHEVQNIATALSMLKEKDKEIEKKDKTIYEMANNILKFRADTILPTDIEGIMQYFEKKAEERKRKNNVK